MKTKIDIIYSDEDVIVINKPPGMLSIPDRFETSKENLSILLRSYFTGEIFVVHRIDRETSGILCFARNAEAHKHLNNQFLHHTVDKIYHAFVDGNLSAENGTIDAHIAPHPYQEGKMIAGKVGKEAITHYKVLEKFKIGTFVEIKIETGRTHQIRTHFKYINHPLLIDSIYGKREAIFTKEIKGFKYHSVINGEDEERPLLNRLSLHASKIGLIHPTKNTKMEWEAPFPKDMKATLNQLKKWNKI
jgi:23S rRNA pseudouridine955/2504/2580 synthase/23S rRNA pseudouridine1911/1915/1917 synthase